MDFNTLLPLFANLMSGKILAQGTEMMHKAAQATYRNANI